MWKTVQETAKNYMKQGDYSNAVLVLNRGLQTNTDNLELQKDLGFRLLFEPGLFPRHRSSQKIP